MRFTLLCRGPIPSPRTLQPASIRHDAYLQEQLKALYAVTSTAFDVGNQQIVNGTNYRAILPLSWLCRIEILFMWAGPTPPASRPDVDDALSLLLNAICAPAGGDSGGEDQRECFVLALDKKQLSSINVSADHHWVGTSADDFALLRVTTANTPIDDAVALGGQSFATHRGNVV